jgi:hypothetical protein
MPLSEFCAKYGLPDTLQQKLRAVDVLGPHTLSFLENNDLRGEGNLTIGEVAALRYAEKSWKAENGV